MPAIHRRRNLRVSVASALIALPALQSAMLAQTAMPLDPAPVRTKHAMVVAIQHDATDAGVQILKSGGNAIDAAVAVAFALAVTFPEAGNLGGGGFMLVRMKSGPSQYTAHFIDYREKAPAAATADMYLDAQKNVVKGMSTSGYKAIGVPGTVAGLVYAEKTYGRLTLKQVMAPAIKLATEGFVLNAEECRYMATKSVDPFPESRRIFHRDGNLYQPGERFTNPDLAKTLTRIAADPADFYHGSIAREMADYLQKNGGLITREDLAAYEAKDRKPLTGSYRGYKILTAPPPSSGGIVLLESLNILSGYDLSKMGDRTPEQVHYIVEAFRRAYMDRGDYLGDPDFTAMPLAQMADPAYAAAWRKTIDPVKPSPSATLVRPEGFMPAPPQSPAAAHEKPETTHFSVVDAEGNAVSCTTTLNGFFGSGVTVPGLGFALNNEMDDFASKTGVPNMFGLIQGPANAIGPGKRPLSSMTPTMVLKDGKLVLVLGSPGGSTIITTVANDIVSILDNGLNVQQAADAPRFHMQYLPDVIAVEKLFSVPVAEALAATGYKINRAGSFDEKDPGVWGDSEMIYVEPASGNKTGDLLGADDQRHHFGKAAGY